MRIVIIVVVLLLVAGGAALAGAAYLSPANMAVAHEQVLGLVNGGIASQEQSSNIVPCFYNDGTAARVTTRSVRFRNNAEITTIFSEPLEDSSPDC